MSEIASVLDNKFSEAFELSMSHPGSVGFEDSNFPGLRYELIGLDSLQGALFRYKVYRTSLDTEQALLGAGDVGNPIDLVVSHQILRIPRTLGDGRRFEDLPREAIVGTLLLLDAESNDAIEFVPNTEIPQALGVLALDELAREMSSLRVAQSMPSNY